LPYRERGTPSKTRTNTCTAKILQANPEELLVLWLADQVTAVVAGETNIAKKVLKIADNSLDKNRHVKSKTI
jgi:hypothetical protein